MPLEADGGLPSRLLENEEPILLETPAAPGLDAELDGRPVCCGLCDLGVLQSEPCSSSTPIASTCSSASITAPTSSGKVLSFFLLVTYKIVCDKVAFRYRIYAKYNKSLRTTTVAKASMPTLIQLMPTDFS